MHRYAVRSLTYVNAQLHRTYQTALVVYYSQSKFQYFYTKIRIFFNKILILL